jgi:hypothetical protein
MKQFIYGLVDPRTGLVSYVGKSNDPEKRFISHLNQLNVKTNKIDWIKQLIKQKLVPELVIIDECIDENVNYLEIFWIKHFKVLNSELTNMTEGGTGGRTRVAPGTAVFCSNGSCYPSISECSRATGIDRHAIRQVLNGHYQQSNGLHFSKTEQGVLEIPRPKAITLKPGKICCSNGQVYESVHAAGEALGLNPRWIYQVLRGDNKTSGGFEWWAYDKGKNRFGRQGKPVKDLNTGIVYASGAAAARALGLNQGRVSAQLLGKYPGRPQYNFEFVAD